MEWLLDFVVGDGRCGNADADVPAERRVQWADYGTTSGQTGTVTGSLSTTGSGTDGLANSTVELGGKTDSGGGNFSINASSHLKGGLVIPVAAGNQVNTGIVIDLTRS